jgi:alkylation response protein AidB-like acyl-CoA dehydrogenase
VDFALEESQREAADLAALVLGGLDPTDSQRVWSALVDAGLLGLALPERFGGDDLGIGGAAVVLTELGRVAAVTPALATLALGALPLARAGRPEATTVLAKVVADGAVLTAALHEPSAPNTLSPRTTAVATSDGFRVTGVKVGVPDADRAEKILVPVGREAGGPGVLLVDPRAGGVTVSRTPGAGPAAPYRVGLDAVDVPAEALVGGVETLTELHRLAAVGAAAYADGLLAGALALTTAHVASRRQFGRPLATFQAVAQQIANVYLASRTMHLIAVSAAWRLQSGADPGADPEVAAYWVATELPVAIGICHHLHGGLGLDRDYPMHRFSAAASDLGRLVGGATHGLDSISVKIAVDPKADNGGEPPPRADRDRLLGSGSGR